MRDLLADLRCSEPSEDARGHAFRACAHVRVDFHELRHVARRQHGKNVCLRSLPGQLSVSHATGTSSEDASGDRSGEALLLPEMLDAFRDAQLVQSSRENPQTVAGE